MRLSQTPLSSVSMSTAPGSSSARRFHSWKCSNRLVIEPILASTPLASIDDGVVVEQVRDGVLVVGEVLLVGGADVLVDVLQLHEQQRQAVDEADDVRAAAVEVAPHPQLAHAEEMVVLRSRRSRTPAAAA